MKKVLNLLFIFIFILVLTGCSKEDTLTCTKGSEKISITFENNITSKILTTQTFSTKEQAIEFEELIKTNPSKNVKAKRSGNKITLTVTGESIKSEKLYGEKETVKKIIEEEGFNCK